VGQHILMLSFALRSCGSHCGPAHSYALICARTRAADGADASHDHRPASQSQEIDTASVMAGEASRSSLPHFVAGTVAGVSEAFFIHPLDTYKVSHGIAIVCARVYARARVRVCVCGEKNVCIRVSVVIIREPANHDVTSHACMWPSAPILQMERQLRFSTFLHFFPLWLNFVGGV
jgi:hypothetical protein